MNVNQWGVNRSLLFAGLLGSTLLFSGAVWAGEIEISKAGKPAPKATTGGVLLFQDVPTGDEILNGLGIKPKKATRGIMLGETTEEAVKPAKKTRSIVFAVEPEAQNQSSGGVSAAAASEPPPPPPVAQVEQKQNPAPVEKRPSAPMSVAFPAAFALGSAELNQGIRQYADAIAEALGKQKDLHLHISGHTDVSGSDRVNIPLSQQRAETVRQYLIEAHQIDPARLTASGEGSSQLANAANPRGAENRRFQIDKMSAN